MCRHGCRILAEFRTRKAHRVCVRDKDLLKYLLGLVLVVAGYMSAWTAVVMDNWEKGHSILQVARAAGHRSALRFLVCRALWWDYVTEFGEALFMLLGIYLAYCIRNAKVEYYTEKWTLCCSVYIETLFSLSMYIIRHALAAVLEPDHVFLLYFIRCHCTVTVILFLVFAPQENLKLHEAVLSNGEVDIADINLADMDPEDIRAELRRVYTQLQVLRNKTMRKDNPHISKRRGGRKVTHRRFSLQPFHHKHKHAHAAHSAAHEQETTEVSKTPEDSTASGEGGPVPDGPSVTSVSGIGRPPAVRRRSRSLDARHPVPEVLGRRHETTRRRQGDQGSVPKPLGPQQTSNARWLAQALRNRSQHTPREVPGWWRIPGK
ncbi:hypothetical protein MTO96_033448 [Rhipicephalus appendiculatus]